MHTVAPEGAYAHGWQAGSVSEEPDLYKGRLQEEKLDLIPPVPP